MYNSPTAIPQQFILTPNEEKLMDLLVSHFVDFYFENPQQFLKPVLKKVLKKNNNKVNKILKLQ